uniref:Uncharacterized protein n=1 Tax=Timema douglasi TaxID=61478 RepID=A0A7R8VMW5_TIMDO|nr:unnamed protein product [Timema douglasi]
MSFLVLTDGSQLTSDSQYLAVSCQSTSKKPWDYCSRCSSYDLTYGYITVDCSKCIYVLPVHRVSEYLMGDLDSNFPLSASVTSKTKSCENLAQDPPPPVGPRRDKTPKKSTPEKIDDSLIRTEQGVDYALSRAKCLARYIKDVMTYIENRSHLDIEYTKNLIKLAQTVKSVFKEEVRKKDTHFLSVSMISFICSGVRVEVARCGLGDILVARGGLGDILVDRGGLGDILVARGGLGDILLDKGGLVDILVARCGLGDILVARGGLVDILVDRGGLGDILSNLPLHSIYAKALDHDLENSHSNQVTCSLLLGNKFLEPLSLRRAEHEKTRRRIKDMWHSEVMCMRESVSSMKRAQDMYVQRQEDLQRFKERAQRTPADVSEQGKQERRQKEEELLGKAQNAETSYKRLLNSANERHIHLEKVKLEVLQQIRELIVQSDQVIKDTTVTYFQMQHTLTTPIPMQYQTLFESSRLYESGSQYLEFVIRLPQPERPPKDVNVPARPPFKFQPYTAETAARYQERKSSESNIYEEILPGKSKEVPIKIWSSHGGSDSDSICSNHSHDTSPVRYRRYLGASRKILNASSGDELDNDGECSFMISGGNQKPRMSKAAETHNFRKLKTPSRCRECDSYVYFQGLECNECTLICHKKCLESLTIQCGHRKLPPKMTTFGVDLGQHLSETGALVPHIVIKCIDEIDERGILHKGIYRISGAKGKIEKLCQAFENGADLVDLGDSQINVIATVLKLYLRQLPEPLLTFK